MKIDSANIAMTSARQYQRTESAVVKQEAIMSRAATLPEIKAMGTEDGGESVSQKGDDGTDGESSFSILLGGFKSAKMKNISNDTDYAKTMHEIRYETLSYLMNILLGRRPFDYKTGNSIFDAYAQTNGYGYNSFVTSTQRLEMSYSMYESENTSFSTTGTVKTADGREIEFNINLNMSREFETSSYASKLEQVTYMDPLVINLDSDVAKVSDQTFTFDLDCDGVLDEIHMPTSGGFLALDKDKNGTIDNGSELFGTGSGDGFKDLAKYDEDGNGWIDENDSVFEDLLIWSKDADGKDRLVGLSKAGVGAICLASVSTEFSLNDMRTNDPYAAIRKSGFYLMEDGTAGTVQHLDLAY